MSKYTPALIFLSIMTTSCATNEHRSLSDCSEQYFSAGVGHTCHTPIVYGESTHNNNFSQQLLNATIMWSTLQGTGQWETYHEAMKHSQSR